jgi:hypothetical protein
MDKLHWILLIIAFGSFATVVMLGLIMGRSSSETVDFMRSSCGNVSEGKKPAISAFTAIIMYGGAPYKYRYYKCKLVTDGKSYEAIGKSPKSAYAKWVKMRYNRST